MLNFYQLTADFRKLNLIAQQAGVTSEELALILIGLNANQNNSLVEIGVCI